MTINCETEILSNGNASKSIFICRNTSKSNKNIKPLGERSKAVKRQQLMVFLGNMGVLGAGMAVAMPSATLENLQDPEEHFNLTREESSWFSAINTMACPLGGLLVGYLMDRIGRKNAILVTNLIGVIGWILLATASLHENHGTIYTQMLIARFLSGLMIGLCISPVGAYSAEISLPKIRGRLILSTSIAIAGGIFFMYILGYFIRSNWQLIAIISCIYQIFATIAVLPMPESPSWLMQNGYKKNARKSLQYFRGLSQKDAVCEEFETELEQIKITSEISRSNAANNSLLEVIKLPEIYKPLLLMIGFFALQQCSGVVVVIVFAAQISKYAEVSIEPALCAVFVGAARLTTIFFMSLILERWGRRPAGILSAAGMTICMFFLALCGWYPDFSLRLSFLTAACIILHIVFSTLGLLTLPFFMISEVFPQSVRGSASGFTVSVGLLFSFIIVKLFPKMEDFWGMPTVFAFFGCVSLLGVAYIYFLVPETCGRTLLEIEEYFRTGRQVTNNEVEQCVCNLQRNSINKTDIQLEELFVKK